MYERMLADVSKQVAKEVEAERRKRILIALQQLDKSTPPPPFAHAERPPAHTHMNGSASAHQPPSLELPPPPQRPGSDYDPTEMSPSYYDPPPPPPEDEDMPMEADDTEQMDAEALKRAEEERIRQEEQRQKEEEEREKFQRLLGGCLFCEASVVSNV